jgi:hypothetical protein
LHLTQRVVVAVDMVIAIIIIVVVGNSAKTPVPATRNSAASYGIAALIGVTDVRVQ